MKNNERELKAIEIINNSNRISIFLQRVGNRTTAKYGLNQPQFSVLAEIGRNKNINQKNLMGELLLEKSNMSKIVKKLKRMGLIEITVPENDKRSTILNITPEGEKIWTGCMHELDVLKIKFSEPFSNAELEQAVQVLSNLMKLVELHTKSI